MFWIGSIIGFLLGFIGGCLFVFEKIEDIISNLGDIEIGTIDVDNKED